MPTSDAPPQWDRIVVPEEWAHVNPWGAEYRAGFQMGWANAKARCPLKDVWPGTPERVEAWQAGKDAGVKARKSSEDGARA